jgi:hypothetical protein
MYQVIGELILRPVPVVLVCNEPEARATAVMTEFNTVYRGDTVVYHDEE